MIPDFEQNDCADLETDRVVRFIERIVVVFVVAALLVAGLFMWGCAPPPPPPAPCPICLSTNVVTPDKCAVVQLVLDAGVIETVCVTSTQLARITERP